MMQAEHGCSHSLVYKVTEYRGQSGTHSSGGDCSMCALVHAPDDLPCEVVDTSLGSIIASDGWNGHDSIHRGHVDDATPSTRLHLVLLYHLPSGCLSCLQHHHLP